MSLGLLVKIVNKVQFKLKIGPSKIKTYYIKPS